MVSQQTSIEAYKAAQPRTGRRHYQVAEALAIAGPLSDQEISQVTGLPINCITPRRGELVKMGIVKDRGVKTGRSGVRVHIWGV